MPLLPVDRDYLTEREIAHTVHEDAGMTCIVLTNWKLPSGLDLAATDILVRLPAGYPDIAPDMWWVNPAVRCANGGQIPATQLIEVHLGRSWQRWSRHFTAGQWQPGIDRLENYLGLMQAEFYRAANGTAA